MFSAGDKIVYGETGVCTVESIAPLDVKGVSPDKLYYYLSPITGSGSICCPVDSGVYMRPVITKDEALALIDASPEIEPAVCKDNRFNHVEAFYKELFRRHENTALFAIIKGLNLRMTDKKVKSSRGEATLKRAKDILYGELATALEIPFAEVEAFISARTAK